MSCKCEKRLDALERSFKVLAFQVGLSGAKIGLGPSEEVLGALRKEAEGEVQEELDRRARMGKPDGGLGLDEADLEEFETGWLR